MKTKLTLELDLQIKFAIHPGSPRTWSYPGHDSECEILDIKIYGEEISCHVFDKILEKYRPEIEEWCCDQAVDDYEQGKIDNAEHQMELRRDRILDQMEEAQ